MRQRRRSTGINPSLIGPIRRIRNPESQMPPKIAVTARDRIAPPWHNSNALDTDRHQHRPENVGEERSREERGKRGTRRQPFPCESDGEMPDEHGPISPVESRDRL